MTLFTAPAEALEYYASIKDPERTALQRTDVLIFPGAHDRSVNISLEFSHIQDYVTYNCPVRRQRAFALADREGRYWLSDNFVVDGNVITNYDKNHPDKLSAIPDEGSLPDAARYLLWNMLNHSVCQPLLPLTPSDRSYPVLELWSPHPVGPLVIPRYDDNRAALIYAFDMEHGVESYLLSQRAARQRHVVVCAARKARSRKRVRGED